MLLQKIKELCKQRGITVSELERILNFGNGTMHKWEFSNPSIEKVKCLSEYFGISVDDLIGNTDIPSKEGLELAFAYDSLPENKKCLVRQYFSVLLKS